MNVIKNQSISHLLYNRKVFFLAISPHDNRIIALSSNIDLFFPFSAQQIIGEPLSAFFPSIDQWVQEQHTFSALPKILILDSTAFVVSMHLSSPYLILEAEPADSTDLSPDYLAQSLMNETISLTHTSSIDELCHLAALSLQRLSGFGRVMAYRFDENFNGCVIAEANTPPMESYFNHHFPASDIPAQARELYRTNLIRYIYDSTYTPVALLSLVDEPINMSQSLLRSVSPIHLEYLRNMDVASSMSLSIIVNGQLWGLFACHHSSNLSLSCTIRRYCEMFIRLFNSLIQEKLTNESSQIFFRLQDRYLTLKTAFQTLMNQSDFSDAFTALGQSWLDAMESDGICFYHGDNILTYGETPNHQDIKKISEAIRLLHRNDLYASHSINDILYEPLNDISKGVLRIVISNAPRTEILWFRREWIQELKWAGNPDKRMIDPTQRISPRKSFETFKTEQHGKSIPWSTSHLHVAELYKELASTIELYTVQHSLKHQTQLLIQQGKMAMMGEMIDAIAHQWNQPLNALSLLLSSLTLLIDSNADDYEVISNIQQKGMSKIAFMSETIDSFRNFFNPNLTKEPFSITQSINEVSEALLPQLKFNNIPVTTDDINTTYLYGSSNVFKQILLIILSNAHDALMENKIEKPFIHCRIEEGTTEIDLHICDNGGGISPEHIEHIFDPYYSTKRYGKVRGIGLYLIKLIIEEHFGGTISVVNKNKGACFKLTFLKNDTTALQ